MTFTLRWTSRKLSQCGAHKRTCICPYFEVPTCDRTMRISPVKYNRLLYLSTLITLRMLEKNRFLVAYSWWRRFQLKHLVTVSFRAARPFYQFNQNENIQNNRGRALLWSNKIKLSCFWSHRLSLTFVSKCSNLISFVDSKVFHLTFFSDTTQFYCQ